jgi:hypothetical protein
MVQPLLLGATAPSPPPLHPRCHCILSAAKVPTPSSFDQVCLDMITIFFSSESSPFVCYELFLSSESSPFL